MSTCSNAQLPKAVFFSFLFFLSEDHEVKVSFALLWDLINHLGSRSASERGSGVVAPCVRGRQGSPTSTEKEEGFFPRL